MNNGLYIYLTCSQEKIVKNLLVLQFSRDYYLTLIT